MNVLTSDLTFRLTSIRSRTREILFTPTTNEEKKHKKLKSETTTLIKAKTTNPDVGN